MQEIGKFDQKINIANGMEKDMVFMLGKNSYGLWFRKFSEKRTKI